MKTTATVSTKGRFTIPSHVRKKYGIKAGDKLGFKTANGVIRIKPVK